ncbi:MAG: hypothetical protein ABSH52_13660 [Terriglobia bacterium]|jgi:hypothetical protein
MVKLLQAMEFAQAFPGRNKYPTLVPWPPKKAKRILLASGKMQDAFWKLDRSAELLDRARQEITDFKPPSTTLEEIEKMQSVQRDVPMFLDNILIYLRILVDCIADITSQLYAEKDVPWNSFHAQIKWFTNKMPRVDPEYSEILTAHSNWFHTLAGTSDKGKAHDGLRDAVVHRIVRMQLFYQTGGRLNFNRVHAFLYGDTANEGQSLIPMIQKMVDGFFQFLDRYVAHFNDRIYREWGGRMLDLSDERSTVLYESVLNIPSSWLYPVIE